MTAKTSNVLYLTPCSEAEREALFEILAPHSWAGGEFGLMLTDVAFADCVKSLPRTKGNMVTASLKKTLATLRKTGGGDVCLNSAIVG
jgi:hypothetical protein